MWDRKGQDPNHRSYKGAPVFYNAREDQDEWRYEEICTIAKGSFYYMASIFSAIRDELVKRRLVGDWRLLSGVDWRGGLERELNRKP